MFDEIKGFEKICGISFPYLIFCAALIFHEMKLGLKQIRIAKNWKTLKRIFTRTFHQT